MWTWIDEHCLYFLYFAAALDPFLSLKLEPVGRRVYATRADGLDALVPDSRGVRECRGLSSGRCQGVWGKPKQASLQRAC